MKKAYFHNILSIIKKNKVSYVAIMMFVFFSMHMYFATSYLIDDLYLSIDNCFDSYKKYDIAAYVSNGINDSIVEEISNIKGVDDIETGYISYGNIETKEGRLDTEVRTLTEKFALPVDVEGKLPVKYNEVALLKHWAKIYGIKIGDTVTIRDNTYLQEEEYVVTALFETSQFLRKMYYSYGGSKVTGNIISCVAYVNKNALNNNYIDDNYIMMANNSLRGLSKFSDEYRVLCEKYIDNVVKSFDSLIEDDYVIERWNEDVGYILIEVFIDTTRTIRKTLVPILFFVAMMVLIVSISRMIQEQKNEIGIMKINGFSNRKISMIFFIYSASSTILGNILASIVSSFLTERFIIKKLSNIINMKNGFFIFDVKRVLIVMTISLIIITCTTYICIKNILKKESINILNEKKEYSKKVYFYETLTMFRKMPIYWQIVINNMIKDTKRCIGIILSIAGSVLLLTAGIILNRNVYDGYKYQIDNDILFDKIIYFDPKSDAGNEIEKILKDNNINYALCQFTNLVLKNPKNKSNAFMMFVYNNKDDFSKLFKFNTMYDKNVNYNGLFLQEAYKEFFNLKEKGFVSVRDLKGNYKYARTSQYFYNYIQYVKLAAIDKESYEDIYDTESCMQIYIIECKDNIMNTVYEEISDVNGYLYYIDFKNVFKQAFMSGYAFINLMVGMFIFSSIAFSFIVVLNLMKANIVERKFELKILMINGFTKNEIKKYVLLDMFLMILVGSILGIVLGIIMGSAAIKSFNSEATLYMDKINFGAICISLVINAIICYIITGLSIKEINLLNIYDR